MTLCILARTFLLPLALKPPSLSFFQDRFHGLTRPEGQQVILLSAVADRTQGAAQLRRQPVIRHGADCFCSNRSGADRGIIHLPPPLARGVGAELLSAMSVIIFAALLGLVRHVIGLMPIFAFGKMTELAGFSREQSTPTAQLFARLFGNRNLGLAFLVFATLSNPPLLSFALFFNAAHDAFDACAITVPLLKKQGISRPATIFLAFAMTGVVVFSLAGWLVR